MSGLAARSAPAGAGAGLRRPGNFAPSGTTPPMVAYRQSATSSLRARAMRNTCRILPFAVPARLRNHCDCELSGWYLNQRHAN